MIWHFILAIGGMYGRQNFTTEEIGPTATFSEEDVKWSPSKAVTTLGVPVIPGGTPIWQNALGQPLLPMVCGGCHNRCNIQGWCQCMNKRCLYKPDIWIDGDTLKLYYSYYTNFPKTKPSMKREDVMAAIYPEMTAESPDVATSEFEAVIKELTDLHPQIQVVYEKDLTISALEKVLLITLITVEVKGYDGVSCKAVITIKGASLLLVIPV